MKFITISLVLLGCCVICQADDQKSSSTPNNEAEENQSFDIYENGLNAVKKAGNYFKYVSAGAAPKTRAIEDGGIPHDGNTGWCLFSKVKNYVGGWIWWAIRKWDDQSAQSRLQEIKTNEYHQPKKVVFDDLDSMLNISDEDFELEYSKFNIRSPKKIGSSQRRGHR